MVSEEGVRVEVQGVGASALTLQRNNVVTAHSRFGNPRYRLTGSAAAQAGRQGLSRAQTRRHDLMAEGIINRPRYSSTSYNGSRMSRHKIFL
jgi:hypothetical protein